MNYQRNYIPKKSKLNYKIVVPFMLLIAILGFAVFQMVRPKAPVEVNELLQFCNLNPKKAQEVIMSEEVDQVRVFKDYGTYGETLGLYEEPFVVGAKDALLGRTIYLRNLCSDEEFSFLMGADLDSKIPLEQLNNGIYSVEVLHGLERHRFVSETPLLDQFTTMSQNNEAKQVDLIADKTAFQLNSEDAPLDDHYLFINVSSKELEEDHYDIILDPNGLTYFDNGNTNYGGTRKDLKEASEMYDLAVGVQEVLESNGLKVKIIRDQVDPINQFGSGSRTELAYQSDAKYYFQFNLRFSFYKPDKGMTILYSNFATNGLATAIMEELNQNSSLVTSNFTSKNNLKGVYKSGLIDGLDGRHVIRELGGQFTGAGRHRDFIDINKEYKDSKKGMQVVSIDYGFINDDQTYDAWINEKESIIQATADGILKGLRIK